MSSPICHLLLIFEQQRTASLAASLSKSQELANHLSVKFENLQKSQSQLCPLSKYSEAIDNCIRLEENNVELSSQLSALTSKISVLEAEVSAGKEELTNERAIHTSLLEKIREYESRIFELEQSVGKLEGDVDGLSTSSEEEVHRVNGKVSVLTGIVDEKTRDLDITTDLLDQKSHELCRAQDMIRSLTSATRNYSKNVKFSDNPVSDDEFQDVGTPVVQPSPNRKFRSSKSFNNSNNFNSSTLDDDSISEEVNELRRLVKTVGF
ncbi:hypothetical protein GEMRC1_007265 [Eukaryota sp. GEM-RC1]